MFTGHVQIEVNGSSILNTDAIASAASRCAHQAEGLCDRYASERHKRVRSARDKAAEGRLIDAAMDALQLLTPGSVVADGAKAAGLVSGEVEQHALAAIVNGLFGTPLGKLAAIGDAEDAVQAALPRLRQRVGELEQLGSLPAKQKAGCAPSQHVPSPAQQLARRPRTRGYRASAELRLKVLGLADLSLRLQAMSHFDGGILRSFRRDLPRLRLRYGGRAQAAGAPGQVNNGDSEIGRLLNDPSLSFEDMLFYFMLLVAKNQEKKMEQLIKKYDAFQRRQEQKQKQDKALGQATSMLNLGLMAGLTAIGLPPPVSSLVAQLASQQITDGVKAFGEAAEGVQDSCKTGEAATTALSAEEKRYSEQRWMMELERANQHLTRIYNLISNIMKSQHDTQMNAIRNVR